MEGVKYKEWSRKVLAAGEANDFGELRELMMALMEAHTPESADAAAAEEAAEQPRKKRKKIEEVRELLTEYKAWFAEGLIDETEYATRKAEAMDSLHGR